MRRKLRLATVEREVWALELRTTGATYEQIAVEVGYAGKAGAWKAVQRALKATLAEPAGELRTLELARLDTLWASMYERAIDPAARDAARCCEVCLRIMARRARLLGLDAPQRIEEHVVTQAAVDVEIARLEAMLRDADDEP